MKGILLDSRMVEREREEVRGRGIVIFRVKRGYVCPFIA